TPAPPMLQPPSTRCPTQHACGTVGVFGQGTSPGPGAQEAHHPHQRPRAPPDLPAVQRGPVLTTPPPTTWWWAAPPRRKEPGHADLLRHDQDRVRGDGGPADQQRPRRHEERRQVPARAGQPNRGEAL